MSCPCCGCPDSLRTTLRAVLRLPTKATDAQILMTIANLIDPKSTATRRRELP